MLLCCCWRANFYSHYGNQFFRKLEINLSHDPAITLMGTYPKDAPSYRKDTCSTMFRTAVFIIARNWKQLRYPSAEEWITKIWYIYTMEYYSAVKTRRQEICRQMDGTRKKIILR